EHETGEDRNDEKAAVDGRVPEDRVDAVERRIRVVDADLRVPEDVPGLVLVDADRGEYDGHPGQERPHVAEPCGLPRKTRQTEGKQAEGQVEREELDRSLAQILAPRETQAAPEHKGRERPGERAELLRAFVPAEQLPPERERRRGDDPVHR